MTIDRRYKPTWLCRLVGHKTRKRGMQNFQLYCLRCFLPVGGCK